MKLSTPMQSFIAGDKKNRKPGDTAFKQQTLPSWEPIITAGTVLPLFFTVGILFIPTGVLLIKISSDTQEISFDYTECTNEQGVMCAFMKHNISETCNCRIHFVLQEDVKGDVFMYYMLDGFYQNHRRYVKSRDATQLRGVLSDDPSSDCFPFDYGENNKTIVPCGAIANSFFTDKLKVFYEDTEVPTLKKGIAWPSDKEVKYRNPPGDLKEALQNYDKPRNWTRHLWELDPNDTDNNGLENEDFIVWMRPAALSTFRKLYRKIDNNQEPFKHGLPAGNYTLHVEYEYDVIDFDGRKTFILSTTSAIGAKNVFLGFLYVVVGSVCLLLGFAFLTIYILVEKRSSELVKHSTSPDISDQKTESNLAHWFS